MPLHRLIVQCSLLNRIFLKSIFLAAALCCTIGETKHHKISKQVPFYEFDFDAFTSGKSINNCKSMNEFSTSLTYRCSMRLISLFSKLLKINFFLFAVLMSSNRTADKTNVTGSLQDFFLNEFILDVLMRNQSVLVGLSHSVVNITYCLFLFVSV